MKNFINKTVNITAVGFGKNLSVIPKQMEYEGDLYNLIDSGVTCVVKSGDHLSRILTMSDGSKRFHLRNDAKHGIWTLLSMSV